MFAITSISTSRMSCHCNFCIFLLAFSFVPSWNSFGDIHVFCRMQCDLQIQAAGADPDSDLSVDLDPDVSVDAHEQQVLQHACC